MFEVHMRDLFAYIVSMYYNVAKKGSEREDKHIGTTKIAVYKLENNTIRIEVTEEQPNGF